MRLNISNSWVALENKEFQGAIPSFQECSNRFLLWNKGSNIFSDSCMDSITTAESNHPLS